MAITSTRVQSTMVINFKAGVDKEGKDITKSKKFSNVKVTAADEDILLIGTALGALLNYQFTGVVREDDSLVINS